MMMIWLGGVIMVYCYILASYAADRGRVRFPAAASPSPNHGLDGWMLEALIRASKVTRVHSYSSVGLGLHMLQRYSYTERAVAERKGKVDRHLDHL